MLSQTNWFLAASLLMNLFSSTLGQGKPCFLTGNVPLPSDVKPPTDVKCTKPDTFKGIPDVIAGGLKFSQVDYRKFKGSSVGFALQNFSLEKNQPDRLKTISTLYEATAAGLRSRGDKANVQFIKGPAFFLAMQLNRIAKDFKSAQRNLGKTIKNCAKCSQQDKNALKAIGATFPPN